MAHALPTDEEWISNLFLLDLALNFFGKTANSLEQLVHERTNIASLEKILDGDFPRGFVRDSNLISQLKIVFPKEEFADISQRLRPFGLVFESREIADLSFDLNENFQVERIRKMDEGKNGNLQLGDKVISVAERRLLRPIDLIKRRSELNPGQDITLVLERGGVVLKIKQRVGRERLVRLEANRLSDADKQEKLEKFWEREPGG
jgi:hypothetical protein